MLVAISHRQGGAVGNKRARIDSGVAAAVNPARQHLYTRRRRTDSTIPLKEAVTDGPARTGPNRRERTVGKILDERRIVHVEFTTLHPDSRTRATRIPRSVISEEAGPVDPNSRVVAGNGGAAPLLAYPGHALAKLFVKMQPAIRG